MTLNTVLQLKKATEEKLKYIQLAFESDTTGKIYNDLEWNKKKEYILGKLSTYDQIISMWNA